MRLGIFHTDLDGIGNLVLIDYFQLHFDKIVVWDYGFEEIPECKALLEEAEEIIISDLSLSEETYNNLVSKGKHIEIYDHHDTSLWLNDKPNCVHDKNRSGTKIFFEEYVLKHVGRYPSVVKEFVDLVDVYDRWDLESPLRKESENLQRVWSSYAAWSCPDNLTRHDRFITQMSRKFSTYLFFEWNTTELEFIKKALVHEEKAFQDALNCLKIRIDNEGRMFGVWKAWGKISITAGKLLADVSDLDYVICLQSSPDNWGKVSFRSRENGFEVVTLASVGGHLAAGGTSLLPEEVSAFWENDMCFKYAKDWQENTPPIDICRNYK